jgi:hypothetical protein
MTMRCGGAVYVRTLRVFKRCLIMDPKPDKNNVVCCSNVLTVIFLHVFRKSGTKSNSQ